MLVEKNGRQIEVTEKAYSTVYAPKGFKPVYQAPEKPEDSKEPKAPESQNAGNPAEGRLTNDEVTALFKNKQTVSAKLKALGVEFDEGAESKDLKALLESELAARDLMPE